MLERSTSIDGYGRFSKGLIFMDKRLIVKSTNFCVPQNFYAYGEVHKLPVYNVTSAYIIIMTYA